MISLLSIARKFVTLLFTVIALLLFSPLKTIGQGCCSGGSGNPIAGGTSPGVLSLGQMEISSNFQHINSNKFKTKDRDTVSLFDDFTSNYLYTRFAYGITRLLTFSTEFGYFFNKRQIGLNKSDTISSSGIADLLLFPRYNIYSYSDSVKRWDITLGLGYKIPLGSHQDSMLVYTNPYTGKETYTLSPPLIQPTNGSQDFIFYAFAMRGFPRHRFNLFTNAIYIRKGWNSLGQKFGDYSSASLFAGKTFLKKLNVIIQLKGERVGKITPAKNTDLLALYNIDTASTGFKRIWFNPQINFTYKNITIYGLYEYPLYEYVYGTQIAAKTQFTVGFSYTFFVADKKECQNTTENENYQCEMHCKNGGSNNPGKCKVCGMDLIKTK